MNKNRLQTVWWCCMLPSFAASSMLVYEWFQDQEETRLLMYAILCVIVGVIGGMVIVNQSSAVTTEAEKAKAAAEKAQAEAENSGWSAELKQFKEAKILDAADIGWAAGFAEAAPQSVMSIVNGDSAESKIEVVEKPLPVVEPVAKTSNETSVTAEKVSAKSQEKTNNTNKKSEKKTAEKTNVKAASVKASVPVSGSSSGAHPTIALGGGAKMAGGDVIALGGSGEAGEPPALDFSPVTAAPSKTPENNPQPPESEPEVSPVFAFLNDLGAEGSSSESHEAVDRAAAVVARLEAEVAKAEVVAAKLESELAKAEPVAAKLAGEGNAESGMNFAFVMDAGTAPANGEPKPLPEFDKVEDWLAYAAQLVHEQNFDDAIKCYDKVTSLDSKNFDGWYLKSVALRRKGHSEDAIYCVNYALSLRSDDARAFTEKGECLLQLNKHEQALNWFEKTIKVEESNAKAWCGKARSLAAANKHKEAIKCYEKVLSLDPNNEEAKKAKGEIAKRVNA